MLKSGIIIVTLLKLLSCTKEIISGDSAPTHIIANFKEIGLKEGYSILTFKKDSGFHKKNRLL